MQAHSSLVNSSGNSFLQVCLMAAPLAGYFTCSEACFFTSATFANVHFPGAIAFLSAGLSAYAVATAASARAIRPDMSMRFMVHLPRSGMLPQSPERRAREVDLQPAIRCRPE